MGKKSKSESKAATEAPSTGGASILGGGGALDPSLSSLFAKSSGPVKAPAVQYDTNWTTRRSKKQAKDVENEIAKSDEEESDEVMEDGSETGGTDSEEEKAPEPQGRKRKRGNAGEDLEESYMRRIEKEERKAEEKRKAEQAERQKPTAKDDDSEASGSDEQKSGAEDSDEDAKAAPAPVHESLSGGGDKANDVEKSSRTVFLGNVSTQAIKSKSSKKTLLRHLASFCSALPESSGPHKVESIRFRSVPFSSGGGVPKRASFARRDILDETTPSTNAYAVYTTPQAARKAPAALNGTVVLDRHLRVDNIAHPAATDNKRCVFVGNLDFIDNEGPGEDESGKKKKARAPADVEEGLWRTFNANTGVSKDKKSSTSKKNVESVRVIRDQSTRVGKGFAYVQFYDENHVEEALLLNEKKFPPLLPRKIRVTRARKMAKKRDDSGSKDTRGGEAHKTLQGRAGKLLGRAGAAKVKADGKGSIAGNSLVFEGRRATEDGSNQFKVKTKSRGSKGKPKGRSSKRAAAYRAAGGQRP